MITELLGIEPWEIARPSARCGVRGSPSPPPSPKSGLPDLRIIKRGARQACSILCINFSGTRCSGASSSRSSATRRCCDRNPSLVERAAHRDELRHCILPRTVCERTLTGTIGVHDEDRCVGLERGGGERGFVTPTTTH